MKLYTGECDVGDIFRADFNAFVEKFGPFPLHHYKVANAIIQCRTEHLGGFVYKCDSCDHEAILYNSCRDRHCPKCQAMARARWVQRRLKEVLPTPYFHVVFTVPHQLNPIALRNKRAFYNILFKAVSETLLKLGKDPRRLGGKVGFIAVLHTWTQKLLDHFHVHCIIPGGALNAKDNAWIPSKEKFLFPVPVMRKLFRGKFMAYFKKAVKKGEINPLNIVTPDVPSFDSLIKDLYSTDWVVYVKEPFATAKEVVKYVGRYTHRVAISNNRIIAFENGKVTFTYKYSSDKNRNDTLFNRVYSQVHASYPSAGIYENQAIRIPE